MGGLIQTKGTQRLAKWFNKKTFADLKETRKWKNKSGVKVPDAFRAAGRRLLDISDDFIAQNASTAAGEWPSGMNDIFYPSATLAVVSGSGSTLTFNIPGTKPDAIMDTESFVSCLRKPNRLEKGTKVQTAVPVGNVLTVTLTKPLKTAPTAGELFSFSHKKGKHERLVKRWRWYLDIDLEANNNDKIRTAISTALDDEDNFGSVSVQAVEDVQRVMAAPQPRLNPDDDEFEDWEMSILLFTQATTSPEKMDPQ